MPTKERNKLRAPFTNGRWVRELKVENDKPWLIAENLRVPGNFTVRRKRDKGTVEVWSIFPEAVDEAIKKVAHILNMEFIKEAFQLSFS